MSIVFYCEEFNDCDLDNGKTPLRKKFNEIIKDLEENNSTSQGNIKLIKGDGNIEYFRAKLSDSDRLLFTRRKHNDKDAFVILEVILNHDYHKSKFLTNREKIRNMKIIDEKIPDTVEIEDAPQVSYLGKFITFSAKQEEIVKNASNLPLVVSGSAGSGKTSVALEKLRKIEEEFKEGRILYITKSENLIKRSKELYEYVYWDETANDFKIGIPDRIEFLSLHKFLEKQAEGIKGKKPVDRNSFFSWFNEICKKDKFKEYKKDGDKIFEEFIAVIAGGGLGRDGKDRYAELGTKQSVFLENERCSIYDFFEEYKKFIEGSSEYYDTGLIAHECIEKVQANYDAVVVDEVQDLTKSVLDLILKSLKDENKSNFLLCGDVNQVIHPSFFSVSRLKSFFHNGGGHNKGELRVCTLEENYRNSKQVIELANRILHFKNYCFASEDKMTEKEKKFFFMESKTGNTGNVGFIANGKEQEIKGKVHESVNWAVLVLDNESKEDARKLFKTPLVFNIHEAKGLEFENVILYEFTSHEAYNKMWNIAYPDEEKVENTIKEIRDSCDRKDVNTSRNKNKEDKSFERYKFYMNALYVGVTRAINSVYIIDDEKKCNLLKVIKSERVSNIDIKEEESTPEKWRDMALKLIDEGNVEQAKNIAIEKLPDKKEYAEEIVDVLKARGYNKEAEDISNQLKFPLDKDKSEQTMRSSPESEIDIENLSSQSPQRRSMSESRTPAETGEHKDKKRTAKLDQNKAQLDQNKNQEKKLPKLNVGNKLQKIISRDQLDKFKEKVQQKYYSKEEMLGDAVQVGSFKIAKYLIGEGADVNVKNEKGLTLLHFAVIVGYEGIVKLLINSEADVNAKNEKGLTPLHFAAQKGKKDVVELLLEHEADVNAKDEEGWTPLYFAAQEGKKDVVELLLKHGADVNAKNEKGLTPLHLAVQKDVVELLLKHGADVNAKNEKDCTPLHLTAVGNNKDVVELLLKHGADVNAKTSDESCTPLHAAVQKDVVELLLKHGADVNAKTRGVSAALALALKNGHSEVVDLLLADPNINVGCVKVAFAKKREDQGKVLQKLGQDNNLFKKVKEAAEKMKNGGELGESLKEELENLLKADGFKLGLNYSPDGDDKNTTVKIAIKAGGELLQLLYDYAEENIGVNSEIFKRLEYAKENPQPRSSLNDVTTPHNLAQAQVSTREC